MSKLKILFLLRSNYNYGAPPTVKAGLFNSVEFLSKALREHANVETQVRICQDGNSIDREVHTYKPNLCVLDAIWVTPTKMAEVQKLHKSVIFIIRIHSKIPFLATEGMSLAWVKEFIKIPNVLICNNSEDSSIDFNHAEIPSLYLPNIYNHIEIDKKITGFKMCRLDRKVDINKIKEINIGCFGAIRPLKNQLLQAFAAIWFANKHGLKLKFHINAGRVEQRGEEPLKNMRALFLDTTHELVEHSWFSHKDFLKVISQMDLGIQCSYTESYNIVAADFVDQGVPIVVSDEIYWMPEFMQVDVNDAEAMARKLRVAYLNQHWIAYKSARALNEQRQDGIEIWKRFLKHFN